MPVVVDRKDYDPNVVWLRDSDTNTWIFKVPPEGADAVCRLQADSIAYGRAECQDIIRDCQKILAEYLPPDGSDAKETISKLLAILDGPRAREALKRE